MFLWCHQKCTHWRYFYRTFQEFFQFRYVLEQDINQSSFCATSLFSKCQLDCLYRNHLLSSITVITLFCDRTYSFCSTNWVSRNYVLRYLKIFLFIECSHINQNFKENFDANNWLYRYWNITRLHKSACYTIAHSSTTIWRLTLIFQKMYILRIPCATCKNICSP